MIFIRFYFLFVFIFLKVFISFSQIGTPVNGTVDNYEGITAFTNCTLIKDPQSKLVNATLLIQKGKVVGQGINVSIPLGAKIIDLNGKWIYPSFIDVWSDYGINKASDKKNEPGPQFLSSKKGPWYWNEAIHPETMASSQFAINAPDAKSLIDLGFGMVATHQQNGISRGTGLLVTLGNLNQNRQVINTNCGQYFSFKKGNSNQDYPSSLMGSIALLRQFYYDAKWYSDLIKTNKVMETNLSLEAYKNSNLSPSFFDAGDAQEILRADKLGDEFGIQYNMKGNGDEYQFVKAIKNTNANLSIPLNFPDPYDVEDPFDARLVSLMEMKHWELAPFNPAILYKNGIEFSITLNGMKKKDKFLVNLRKAIDNGLPEEYALKALTTNPAKSLKSETLCGTLDIGKLANFIITDGNIFKEGSSILENWVNGEQNLIVDWQIADYAGKYSISIGDSVYKFLINGKPWQPKVEFIPKQKGEIKMGVKNNFITLQLLIKNGKQWMATGYQNGKDINLITSDSIGKQYLLVAKYLEKADPSLDSVKKNVTIVTPEFSWPWQYKIPVKSNYLIKNCTVWTSDKNGILLNKDVLIQENLITGIGQNLKNNDAIIINGNGMHLTPGIIDEHSHIAISKGVNEGTQSITSEVRIEDVVNAKDVNIYRQLAGGVTTSHLLHGSANAIGGQTALIKLKYGESSDKLIFPNDHRFIKLALGENVKQSNWGDFNTTRFPQTRMGVEQVFYDGFSRAKAYEQLKKKPGYRTDLELEALLEIINGKRFITCHSYVQSEINMLMHVADTFGFRVNTFTHILEGYKVADKMKKHGVAASTFADWWAYKYEVVDAIPHNAGILNKVGVLTGINSDDAEMGRRLNQEAAKTVKYSNVSEIEALKMITINPAQMLHIDKRVGSITMGKDADIVLWDGNPLSNYSKPLTTWVDGKIYFDRNEDLKKRAEISAERQRLIKAMVLAKKAGHATQKAVKNLEAEYHCED